LFYHHPLNQEEVDGGGSDVAFAGSGEDAVGGSK